ncbi:unnamed protein product [Closterium sp. NIES-65]|nr:unnamed protein product [Closterium sp. NIES-65]
MGVEIFNMATFEAPQEAKTFTGSSRADVACFAGSGSGKRDVSKQHFYPDGAGKWGGGADLELRGLIEEPPSTPPSPLIPLPSFSFFELASGGADMELRGKLKEAPSTPPSPLIPSSKQRRRHGVERQYRGGSVHATLFLSRLKNSVHATLSLHTPFPSLPPLPPPFAAPFFHMELASGGADMELRGKIEGMELASGGADMELRGKIEELRAVSSASVAQTNSSMEQMQQQFAALSRRLGELDRRVTSAMQDPTMRLVLQGSAPLFSPSLGEGEDRSSPPSLGEEGERGGDSERRGEGSQGVGSEGEEAGEGNGEAGGSGEARRGSGGSGEDARREGGERREEGGGGSDGAGADGHAGEGAVGSSSASGNPAVAGSANT